MLRRTTAVGGLSLCLLWPLLVCSTFHINATALALGSKSRKQIQQQQQQHSSAPERYDLVIVGAGASGLFASGAAVSFGLKTLLLDRNPKYVGGDCSNAACVPSKALRSISRMAWKGQLSNNNPLQEARDHTFATVSAIRAREDISNLENVTNLDLALVQSAKFTGKDAMEIVPYYGNKRQIQAKNFIIATGASPFIPPKLQEQAAIARVPLFTYRDILSPDSPISPWNMFCNNSTSTSTMHLAVAGGGPTAVELGQSLARIGLKVTIVAPTLLAGEDVALQRAACQVLRQEGVTLVFGRRVVGITQDKGVKLDNGTCLRTDAMVACFGRKPTVADLDLDQANIAWDADSGIDVHPASLQSTTNRVVFACGDCCSAIRGKSRRAAHGAWTGYHAVRNIALPNVLWRGSPSVHPTVPSVTYADPELVSVGLSKRDCILKYGTKGYLSASIREDGNDRADMESQERYTEANFIELRAAPVSGRILGLTACGPAAAELGNEIGLAIQTRLSVRDLAKSIHSYPSHGYLLYRLALSMALSTTRGFLDTLGPVCRFVGKTYGVVSNLAWSLRRLASRGAKRRQWEAAGEDQVLIVNDNDINDDELPISYLHYYTSGRHVNETAIDLPESFINWVNANPPS